MKTTYTEPGRELKLPTWLAAAALAASFACVAAQAKAGPVNSPRAAATAAPAQGPAESADHVYFYHHFKRYAESDLRERKAAGRDATMYYDNALKKWVVRVRKRGASSSSPLPPPNGSSSSSSTAASGAEDYYYYSFHSKANAESSLRSHTRMGKEASMGYDSAARKWVVRVRKGGASSAGDTGWRAAPPDAAVTSGPPPTLPPGATVLYFPTRSNAEGIYKASLRQGDWAWIWYDAKRKEWAVAVKPRLGKARRGGN